MGIEQLSLQERAFFGVIPVNSGEKASALGYFLFNRKVESEYCFRLSNFFEKRCLKNIFIAFLVLSKGVQSFKRFIFRFK